MALTEDQKRIADMFGHRDHAAFEAKMRKIARNTVMATVGQGGRLNVGNGASDDDALLDEDLDAMQCATMARDCLQKFIDGPHEDDASSHIARGAAMAAAALHRVARDKSQAAKIAGGFGLQRSRW
jgi:hypothetical protein